MSNKSNGIGISLILFIVFLTLKLTNNIDWSWWWVTSPLWIPSALVLSVTITVVFILFLLFAFGLINIENLKKKIEEKKKNIKI
jgi:hypothetical protein